MLTNQKIWDLTPISADPDTAEDVPLAAGSPAFTIARGTGYIAHAWQMLNLIDVTGFIISPSENNNVFLKQKLSGYTTVTLVVLH